jgi:hypothetical protein
MEPYASMVGRFQQTAGTALVDQMIQAHDDGFFALHGGADGGSFYYLGYLSINKALSADPAAADCQVIRLLAKHTIWRYDSRDARYPDDHLNKQGSGKQHRCCLESAFCRFTERCRVPPASPDFITHDDCSWALYSEMCAAVHHVWRPDMADPVQMWCDVRGLDTCRDCRSCCAGYNAQAGLVCTNIGVDCNISPPAAPPRDYAFFVLRLQPVEHGDFGCCAGGIFGRHAMAPFAFMHRREEEAMLPPVSQATLWQECGCGAQVPSECSCIEDYLW